MNERNKEKKVKDKHKGEKDDKEKKWGQEGREEVGEDERKRSYKMWLAECQVILSISSSEPSVTASQCQHTDNKHEPGRKRKNVTEKWRFRVIMVLPPLNFHAYLDCMLWKVGDAQNISGVTFLCRISFDTYSMSFRPIGLIYRLFNDVVAKEKEMFSQVGWTAWENGERNGKGNRITEWSCTKVSLFTTSETSNNWD
jgi:hypothetical protein